MHCQAVSQRHVCQFVSFPALLSSYHCVYQVFPLINQDVSFPHQRVRSEEIIWYKVHLCHHTFPTSFSPLMILTELSLPKLLFWRRQILLLNKKPTVKFTLPCWFCKTIWHLTQWQLVVPVFHSWPLLSSWSYNWAFVRDSWGHSRFPFHWRC